MIKKVLLIGGSGFLGSHVLKELQSSNLEVMVVQNKVRPAIDTAQLIEGGIKALNHKLIDSFRPDVVIHCARPVFRRWGKTGRKIAARRASRLNLHLLRELEKSNGRPPLLFASGSLVYGNSHDAHDENSPLHPISYARQYLRGEMPVNIYLNRGIYPVKILRFPWLLGKGSWFKWFYMDFVEEKNALPLFGDGNNSMSIMDVEDAAKLLLLYAGENTASGIYNVHSPFVPSQSEFLKMIASVYDTDIKPSQTLFAGKPERAITEAFTSNIILKSNSREILDSFKFTELHKTLSKLKDE